MKKTFRYILFSTGCILGTLIGIWVFQEYQEKIRNIGDYLHGGRRRALEESRSSELAGDPTTDAPPPLR